MGLENTKTTKGGLYNMSGLLLKKGGKVDRPSACGLSCEPSFDVRFATPKCGTYKVRGTALQLPQKTVPGAKNADKVAGLLCVQSFIRVWS